MSYICHDTDLKPVLFLTLISGEKQRQRQNWRNGFDDESGAEEEIGLPILSWDESIGIGKKLMQKLSHSEIYNLPVLLY